jgi:hypothetical protein
VPVLTVAIEAPGVPVAVVAEVPTAQPQSASAPAVVVPEREAAATTAVRAQLAGLLKSKSGLQSALILREIFDKPKCRRS